MDGHLVDSLVFDDLVEEGQESTDEETVGQGQRVEKDLDVLCSDGLVLDSI